MLPDEKQYIFRGLSNVLLRFSINVESVTLLTASATAAGCILFSLYPDLDNIGRSSHSRVHRYGPGWAVVNTGAAFNACIKICDPSSIISHFKNTAGAYQGAESASDTFFLVQDQG